MVNPWLSDNSVTAARAAALDSKVEDEGGENQNVNMYTGDMQSDTQTKERAQNDNSGLFGGLFSTIGQTVPFCLLNRTAYDNVHLLLCLNFGKDASG